MIDTATLPPTSGHVGSAGPVGSSGGFGESDGGPASVDTLLPDLLEVRREIARLHAREARLLARADDIAGAVETSDAEFAHRSAAAEIAAGWRVSDRTVQRQMADASRLVAGFPRTLASLEAGRISAAHVRVIVEAGGRIERPELRAEFEASVLPYAEAESATRLAPVARRRAEWFLDETLHDRHRRARAGRRVWVTDLDDGMAELGAILPAVLAHGVLDRLTQLAHADRDAAGDTAGEQGRDESAIAERESDERGSAERESDERGSDERSIDERRADIFSDLLLATDPTAHVARTETGLGSIRASVQVTVPVLSLLGAATADPFEAVTLGGFGPIDDDTARELAASAPGWDRILTHPITGAVLSVDRYRPSDQMRRHLQVRDQHCRFPGCRVPARSADLDHTIDHQYGGETSSRNLAHLCRRHHSLKHQTSWKVKQLSTGTLEWISPAGRRYTDVPPSSVFFSPDPECDPPEYDAPPF